MRKKPQVLCCPLLSIYRPPDPYLELLSDILLYSAKASAWISAFPKAVGYQICIRQAVTVSPPDLRLGGLEIYTQLSDLHDCQIYTIATSLHPEVTQVRRGHR